MTRDELRSIIIECLRKPRQHSPHSAPFSVNHLCGEVAIVAHARSLKTIGEGHNAWHDEGGRIVPHPHMLAPIWAIVWDLIIESVLRPGTGNEHTFELPHIYVTEYGHKALADQMTPHDPAGYLKRLQERIPKLDPTILIYLAESVETLRRNCLLSSTVTLGCASEQAMLILIEKTADACGPAKKASFEAAFRNLRSIKLQNTEYRKWFDANLRARLSRDKGTDWLTELENALSLLFNYFRTVRNDAGHPTGAKISREEAMAHLVLFPRYLELLYDQMEWLDSNNPI